MRIHLVCITALAALAMSVYSPITRGEDKKSVQSSEESIVKGKAIYKKQCQMCHGEKGLGDGPAGRLLNPKPLNFTDKEKMGSMDDGKLYEKISKGNGPMPPFEHKLSEADRWHVVHFVRTFAAGSSK